MVLSNGEINIIADMEGTTGVKLHNNRQKLRARFDIRKKLGQGTYGKVQLAINKDTGEEVAIKTIKKTKIETEQDLIRIQREIQIMSSVQHPHIIHIYEVFENREKIVLVMEYASGGELYDFLSYKKVLEESEARKVFRQVASAVFYCHKNMICHRDLKLENILLDERGSAKIADFGLSNVFDERHFLSTFCGSPLYASPEIVRGTPYYGPEVDCWSLGVLLYTLVYGAMPFDGSNFKKLVRQISEGDYYEPKVPSEASKLIRRMLTVDPGKRANIEDICCDVWVDLGEEVSLWDLAQEMCKQMPVRLDYLLALTATAPHPPADLPRPSATPEDIARNDAGKCPPGNGDEEDHDEQWERPALQMKNDSSAQVDRAAAAAAITNDKPHDGNDKKHKLASSSSLLGTSTKVAQKKKKYMDDDEDNDRGGGTERCNVDAAHGALMKSEDEVPVADEKSLEDKDVEIAEKEVEFMETSQSFVEATNTDGAMQDESATTCQEIVEATDENGEFSMNGEENSLDTCLKDETSHQEDVLKEVTNDSYVIPKKQATTKRIVPLTSTVKKNISEDAQNNSTCTTKMGASQAAGPNNGAPVTKVPKLKKSTSIGKETNGTSTGSSVLERRKLSVGSSRILETKKAFEPKVPDKKPVVIPGLKVSSARKTFESSPVTSETSKVNKAPLHSTLRKNSSTANDMKPNQSEDGSTLNSEDSNTSDRKKPLLRQDSRKGLTRTTSPTKSIRSSGSSSSAISTGGQHHTGCVPHDAKSASSASDTKQSVSPPKPVFRRKSPPQPLVGDSTSQKNHLSKPSSFSKPFSDFSARRSSATNVTGRPLNSVRPRSPVKSVKGNVTANKSAVSSNAHQNQTSEQHVIENATSTEPQNNTAEQNEVPCFTSTEADTLLSEKMNSVNISEENPSISVEKRGSIEIAPLSCTLGSGQRNPDSTLEEGNVDVVEDASGPQIRFLPRDKGHFTLLGVKSEVLFDVNSLENVPENADNYCEPKVITQNENSVMGQTDAEVPSDNSKIIRYVATVQRHGCSDDAGPERVTLLNIRRSETGMTLGSNEECSQPQVPDSGVPSEEISNPLQTLRNTQSSKWKDSYKTCHGGVIEEKNSEVEQSTNKTEQHGYSVYRSKYRSVQKYRSIVERMEDEYGHNANDEETMESVGSVSQESKGAERSDSFSSNGSTDDMEDVFESLTSESLFSSLLSRTRHLIDRITEGDSHASRWFQSGLLGDRSLRIMSSAIDTPSSSFFLNSPSLSFRHSNTVSSSKRNYAKIPEYGAKDINYSSGNSSVSGRSNRIRRWRYSRSSSRNADEDDDPGIMSDSGSMPRLHHSNVKLQARSSFNSRSDFNNYSNGYGSSLPFGSSRSCLSTTTGARQSRYDAFRSQDAMPSTVMQRREEARSDIISALMSHRNRSLDGRRPRSLYDDDESWSNKTGSVSLYNQKNEEQLSDQHNTVTTEYANEQPLYGTTRRSGNWSPHYSKSASNDMKKECCTKEIGNISRPRSVHVLDEPGADDSVSASRDYSKSSSCAGNAKCEEEEEYEHEKRIIEDKDGRSVTTTHTECKRSVSKKEDEKSHISSVHVHTSSSSLRRPIKKQISDEDSGLSRQDSGVGSLYESSVPNTPLSTGSHSKRGILRYGRSVSNDLESLGEEFGHIRLRNYDQQEQKPSRKLDTGDESSGCHSHVPSDGYASEMVADGTATPASDSGETGSVCSDSAGTETSTSTIKASEEESVGERIRRKSFFARFNESHIPRKGRKSSVGSTSAASLRSDLSHSSSLHRRHLFEEEGLGFSGRMQYDLPSDYYVHTTRVPHRWSTYLGTGGGISDSEHLFHDQGKISPHRSSLQGGGGESMSFMHRPESRDGNNWYDNGCSEAHPNMRATSPINRTHSLPEEINPSNAGRPVYRQMSMPGNAGYPSASQVRRPTHLRFYSRHGSQPTTHHSSETIPCEETGEIPEPDILNSPSSSSADRSTWRSYCQPGSVTDSRAAHPRMTASTSASTGESWETGSRHRLNAATFASLMDSLESPTEVLQKAMDICDSLRYT